MIPRRIGWFAQTILGKRLYPYQEEAGDAILDSILTGAGHTFTIMFARQMGKNELSAALEAYLLFCHEEGTIIKAAPTFKPQIVTSRLRLLTLLDAPSTRARVWRSFGYMVGLAPSPALVEAQAGPRVQFFSAGPESHIVGATASLLLEVDEAQDIDEIKYDVELKPMASTTNATTVMYGTAWSDDTLLARQVAHNAELEAQDGVRRHFQADWQVLAAINPHYGRFVEREIARLGSEHVSIRTQYRLLPISGAGFLLSELQRHLIRGTHAWEEEPEEDTTYVAGLDVGGEERSATPNTKHDSTVLTIGRVSYNALDLPTMQVVHQQWWTGMTYLDQYAAVSEIMQRWNIRTLVIDKTGLGAGLASLLVERFTDERVVAFNISRPSKSHLTYQLLGLVNSGRCKLYAPLDAPTQVWQECWQQLKHARYRVPGEGLLTMYVDEREGHDDFLLSIALCGEALRTITAPVGETLVIRPRQRNEDKSRF